MDIPRDEIMARLRPLVATLMTTTEKATSLQVRFTRLPVTSNVSAGYTFDPYNNIATVSLSENWVDVDVAHEMKHIQLELIDGYSVLAWRHNVPQTDGVLAAVEKIRTVPDDEVVHSRLIADGFKLDGEVIKSQFFDDRCTKIPRNLRAARSMKNDGMAYLDRFGYGDLYRATLFVQVQIARDKYSDLLSPERLALLDEFVDVFPRFRPRQHRLALRILELFEHHDVYTLDGHAMILEGLAKMGGVSQFMGVSSYVMQSGKYILPWPTD